MESQLQKIFEEFQEAQVALRAYRASENDGSTAREIIDLKWNLVMEILDIAAACITFVVMLGYSMFDVDALIAAHNKKDAQRGYYDED